MTCEDPVSAGLKRIPFTGGKDYVLTKITKEYMWFETELGQIGFNTQGEGPDCVNNLFDEDELTFAKLKVGMKET